MELLQIAAGCAVSRNRVLWVTALGVAGRKMCNYHKVTWDTIAVHNSNAVGRRMLINGAVARS